MQTSKKQTTMTCVSTGIQEDFCSQQNSNDLYPNSLKSVHWPAFLIYRQSLTYISSTFLIYTFLACYFLPTPTFICSYIYLIPFNCWMHVSQQCLSCFYTFTYHFKFQYFVMTVFSKCKIKTIVSALHIRSNERYTQEWHYYL